MTVPLPLTRRFATHPLYRYESGDYAVAQPGMNEFVAFNLIIKRFVADGSPEEINIRCAALQLTGRCVCGYWSYVQSVQVSPTDGMKAPISSFVE